MRQYDKKEVAHILGKFMTGETSLDEERLLAEYFRTHEVKDEWQEYKEMFALFDSGSVDIESEEESKRQTNITDAKVRKLPKAVNEKPKIIPIRWLMTGIAASVLLLIGFSLFKKDEEPKIQNSMVVQVSKPAEVKPTTETPPVTYDEPLVQQQPKKDCRRKQRAVTKPQEAPVQYMTDEMVDQLLARNHQVAALQPTFDNKEIENEIRRRGELLTNDLLAFATNK